MPLQPLPDWIQPALDGRFNELARMASQLDDVMPLRHQQTEIEKRLKQELTSAQFTLILEWEEKFNYRHTIEKEWMYRAGLRDGMQMARSFYLP